MRIRKITCLLSLAAILMAALFAAPGAHAKFNDKILNRPYADGKRIHLGFSIGMSLQDFVFTNNGQPTADGNEWYVQVPSWQPGVNVSVLADLRLGNHFNLRFWPGMSFGSKLVEMRSPALEEHLTQDVKSIYVLLPIDLKVSGARYQNARPYVTVGAMGAFDVGKKHSDYLKFNTADAYLTLGIGCDFYLPFFKLNPEVKFCFGLTDILQHKRPDLEDDIQTIKITQALKKVKSNIIMITFFFE